MKKILIVLLAILFFAPINMHAKEVGDILLNKSGPFGTFELMWGFSGYGTLTELFTGHTMIYLGADDNDQGLRDTFSLLV